MTETETVGMTGLPAPEAMRRPSHLFTVRHISPRIGVRVKKEFTVTINPYYDDYIARSTFLPAHVVSHEAGRALDALLGVFVNRLVRFHMVWQDLTPDLYDEYMALMDHFEFL